MNLHYCISATNQDENSPARRVMRVPVARPALLQDARVDMGMVPKAAWFKPSECESREIVHCSGVGCTATKRSVRVCMRDNPAT